MALFDVSAGRLFGRYWGHSCRAGRGPARWRLTQLGVWPPSNDALRKVHSP